MVLLSFGWWMDKLQCTQTVDYYGAIGAIERSETLMQQPQGHVSVVASHSERSQSQKDTYYIIPCPWLSGKGRIIETENRFARACRWLEGSWGHYRGTRRDLLGCWNCLWCWLHNSICLCKLLELYTKKGRFYCMQIVPWWINLTREIHFMKTMNKSLGLTEW